MSWAALATTLHEEGEEKEEEEEKEGPASRNQVQAWTQARPAGEGCLLEFSPSPL